MNKMDQYVVQLGKLELEKYVTQMQVAYDRTMGR